MVLAKVVSRVFDPIIEIPVAIGLSVWVAVMEGLRWRFLGALLFIDLLMPFIFMMTMMRHGQISEFDIRKKEQRIPLYFFTMLCHLVGVWLAYAVGKIDLAHILSVFWILGVVFSMITVFWKISLHGGVNAVLAVFVNVLFGYRYWWLFLILPVVGWARVYDKHHDVRQFVVGALLGGGVSFVALKTIGF